MIRACSNTKSFGRFCRSVEMMTQRPVTGSLRSSGTVVVVGHWSLVIGHCSLVVGRWSFVVGRWSWSGGVERVLENFDDGFAVLEMNRDDVEAAGAVGQTMSHGVVERELGDPVTLQPRDGFGGLPELVAVARL